jgi:hypothetical protein
MIQNKRMERSGNRDCGRLRESNNENGRVELATGVTGRVLQNINSEPALMDIRLVLLRINLIHRDLPTYA